MKPDDFRKLLSLLKDLTPHQRQVLMDRLQPAVQASASYQVVETRMSEKPVCPHCAHEQVSRWGFANSLQRYRCSVCRATFNALTETPLAGLRHKAKWIDYAKQLAEGTSVRKVPLQSEFIPTRHSAGATASLSCPTDSGRSAWRELLKLMRPTFLSRRRAEGKA